MNISRHWLPAIIVPTVIAVTSIAVPMSAAAVNLPDLTPQEVILLMDAPVEGFSGTIVKTSNLGLPAFEFSSMVNQDMVDEMTETMPEGMEEFIPQVLEQNPLMDAIALLAGTHKVRVYASEEGARIQVLDTMSQRDLIINKDEFWIYDSRKATATTGVFPEMPELSAEEQSELELKASTALDEYSAKLELDLSSPEALANFMVQQVEKDAEVTVGVDHRVAGRTAYQLIMTPDAANTLISKVVVSVDSETGMALDFKVYSVELEEPAFHVGFTDITYGNPDSELFSFTPPAGTTVQTVDETMIPNEYSEEVAELKATFEEAVKELDSMKELTEADKLALQEKLKLEYDAAVSELTLLGIEEPQLLGIGWESVLYIPASPKVLLEQAQSELPEEIDLEALTNSALLETEVFADLFIEVEGGRVFSTPVMNILLMDNGDIYIGSVTVDYLTSKFVK